MPRMRTLKPSFFSNDKLAEVHPLGRLLFEGLWCMADREGRLEDRPKKIKAEILPYDNANVDKLLQDLADRGFIQRYVVDEHAYIQIVNFLKHQQPHYKEVESIIPAPPDQPHCNASNISRSSADHRLTLEQSLADVELQEQEQLVSNSNGLHEQYSGAEAGAVRSATAAPPRFDEDEQRTIDLVGQVLSPFAFTLAPGHWRKVLDEYGRVDLEAEAYKQADWLRRHKIKVCSASRYANWQAKALQAMPEPVDDDGEYMPIVSEHSCTERCAHIPCRKDCAPCAERKQRRQSERGMSESA